MMGVGILLILACAGASNIIIYKKKLFYILCFALYVLMWMYKNECDYMIYFENYTYGMHQMEIGYQIIAKLGKFFNLDFEVFQALMGFISLVIAINVVRNYTSNYFFVIISYFIFQAAYDSIQIRNFMASVLIIAGAHLLVKHEKRFSFFAFIFAALIHRSFIIYLPIPILYMRKNNKIFSFINILLSVSIGVAGILAVCPGAMDSIRNLMLYILKNTEFYEKTMMFFQTRTRMGGLAIVCIGIFNLILVHLSKKCVRNSYCIKYQDILDLISVVYMINAFNLFLSPLLIFNIEFARFFRNVILLNSVCIAISMERFDCKGRIKKVFCISISKVKYMFIVLLDITLWVVGYYMRSDTYMDIMSAMFENNYFFNNLF